MPKILRIINRLNLGGPTYNAAYLTKGLSPEYETILLAGEKDDTEASSEFILQDNGITPRYIKGMRREISLLHDRDAYKQIVKVIREFKPDIVHTHAAKAGTLGRIAAWRENVPVIVHTFHGHVFHSYFSPAKTRFFIEIEKMLSRISTAIVAISEEQKNDLVKVFKVASEQKTHVIPLGFDLQRFSTDKEKKRSEFRSQYGIAEDTIAVGIIGRLVPIKNHSLFINVWAEVSRNGENLHAFIIGDGEDRVKIEQQCRDKNILFNTPEQKTEGASLTFTSWREDVDRVMAGLDVVALTSFNEGTPVSLIEAQASGRPIVSTNVGGIRNAVVENSSALLCPSNDPASFIAHLNTLVQDRALQKRMGESGAAFVMDKYDKSRLVSDMDQLYKLLLSRS
jgi:glycosyltransferase involved in cell wall biosynthesis